MKYGMFEGKRVDNGEVVQGMLIEYGSDTYILTMLGYCHKNEGEFDERFGNRTIETCGYLVDSYSVKQIKTLEEYLSGSSDFEQRYHAVVDGE